MERRVLARRGWVGEKSGLFEHSVRCSSDVLYVWAIECPPCPIVFLQPAQPIEAGREPGIMGSQFRVAVEEGDVGTIS